VKSKPLIYVAGPYTAPDPVVNTHKAVKIGDRLLNLGAAVVIPHVTLLWHLVSPHEYQTWLELDIEVLARCDGLLRFPGESSGADGEVEFAHEHGIPVRWLTEHTYDHDLERWIVELRDNLA